MNTGRAGRLGSDGGVGIAAYAEVPQLIHSAMGSTRVQGTPVGGRAGGSPELTVWCAVFVRGPLRQNVMPDSYR